MSTRVRGFAPWSPRAESLVILEQVRSVLTEYSEHLPLTIRQVFYRLIGAQAYPKTESAYARLGEIINRARRSSRIPFNSIRDDGTVLKEPHCWDSRAELVESFAEGAAQFRFDRQLGQPVRLAFAVEAAGMVPQVERIADEYGIGVVSSGGFDSTTAKYELARRLARWPAVEVLHIGDHDPSGVHMFVALEQDVRAFVGEARNTRFTRLAVTPSQIERLKLPTAAPKATDRRAFTGESVQAEAIAPDVLAEIIRSAIESRLDQGAFAAVLAEEQAVRAWAAASLLPALRSLPQ